MKLFITLITFTVLISACKNPLEESGNTYHKNIDPNNTTIKLNPEADPGPVYQPHQPADIKDMGDLTTIPLWNCSVFENERHQDTCQRIKKTMQKDYLWEDSGFAVSCTLLASHLKTECLDLARNLFKNARAFACEKKLQFSYKSNRDTESVRCKLIQKSYSEGKLIENLKVSGALLSPGEAENHFINITEQQTQLFDKSHLTENLDGTNSLPLDESVATDNLNTTILDPSAEIPKDEKITPGTTIEEAAQELGVKAIPRPQWRPEPRPKKKPDHLTQEAADQLGVKAIPIPTFRDSLN